MSGKLQNRRILITGISRGVGFETAKLFLAEGAEVLGVAKDPARLDRAVTALGGTDSGQLQVLATDLALPESAVRIADAVEKRWGALDILLNNAAIMLEPKDAAGLYAEPSGMLGKTIEANLLSPFQITRALLPLLERGVEPRIGFVSSGAGTFSALKDPGIASYRLSKWALNGLVMLLAQEFLGRVAVNAFDPGWVKTDLGGPQAPGTPDQSALGALALVTLPFSTSGKFWKDGMEIPF